MKRFISVLRLYFEQFGGLVMMGGDVDASSKGIAGIHIADNEAYLLVIVSGQTNADRGSDYFETILVLAKIGIIFSPRFK